VKRSEQEIVKDSREMRLSFHLSDARNRLTAVKYRGIIAVGEEICTITLLIYVCHEKI